MDSTQGNRAPHQQAKSKCMFVDSLPELKHNKLSETHIWPEWLGKIIPWETKTHANHYVRRDWAAPGKTVEREEFHARQSSLFSRRPHLACVNCNTGWMNDIEQKCRKFVKPMFTSNAAVRLNTEQAKQLSAWICLMTIVAESMDKNIRDRVITTKDVRHLYRKRSAPDTWTVVACSKDGDSFIQTYWKHTMEIRSGRRLENSLRVLQKTNSQLVSFGIGKLFIQVFSCPNDQITETFCSSAASNGFEQIWPRPMHFIFFTKRASKFPTKTILTKEQTEIAQEDFAGRLHSLLGQKDL